MGEHILSWMTFFPVIGAAVIAFIPSERKEVIKTVAAAAALSCAMCPTMSRVCHRWKYGVTNPRNGM